jgi:D-alanyl-D-alanine dipeptidase
MLIVSCHQSVVSPDVVATEKEAILSPAMAKTKTEQQLDSLHLVEIRMVDSTILVELKYATADNFTGKILYEDLTRAYLQPEVAQMLLKAQRYVKEANPVLTLLIYDAARPMSVQRAMYEAVRNTPKRNYVANPDKTGLHN